MNKTMLLFGSLIANATLAVVFVSRSPEPAKPQVVETQPAPASKPRIQKVIVEVPAESETVTNWARMDWRTIESADYITYIANLRKAGCPEETIRDIIIADVNKLYATKWKAQHYTNQAYKYWETDKKKGKRDDRNTDERRTMEKERDDLIRSLLGVDLKTELAKYSWDEDRNRDARYAFLSDEKQAQVKELNDRYHDSVRQLIEDGKASNLSKEEIGQKISELRKQRDQELAQTLSPGEMQEYELRNSQLAGRLRNDMAGLNLSEQEFRSLYQGLKDASSVADATGQKFSLENNPAIAAQLQTVLSPDQYAQWQKMQEPAYKDAVKLAQKYHLNEEDTSAVVKINEATDNQIALAMANPNLTPEQKQAAARAIKDEKKKVLSEALGKRKKRK